MFYRHRGENEKPSYAEKVTMIADAGFDVADIHFCDSVRPRWNDALASDGWERAIDEAGEAAAARGITFSQSHSPFNPYLFTRGRQPNAETLELLAEMTRRSIIASGKLGVKWMVFHPLNDTVNCEYDTDIELKTNREYYAPILEQCKKAGVGMALENMFNFSPADYRRSYCENPEDLISLVDSFDDPAVGICWDFGHANFLISDQPRALRKVGSRLKATHVQDNRGDVDSHLIPFVGGNIKWEKIMPCLREIGYEGDFVYEAQSYTQDFPDTLKPDAAKFAVEVGRYLLRMYEGNN